MIKVLIVDDSALVRKILAAELLKHDDIAVVGSAADPYAARDMIVRYGPDVVTLDLEMPRMDGLSFLAKLMKYRPLPVVVVSSLAPKHSEAAVRALELGAVDVICKPGSAASTPGIAHRLIHAVRAASMARVARVRDRVAAPAEQFHSRPLSAFFTMIAVGASTGGTQALELIMRTLPADVPGIIIVQHMPELFTRAFAQRLDSICRVKVQEAADGDRVLPGQALVAPGGKHCLVERSGAYHVVRLKGGPKVHHQRPSVDVLFNSVANSAGASGIGVLLTGMGVDGAKGLLEMFRAGAFTIAQDEASSVVFGMPGEAVRLGAATAVVGLDAIAGALLRALSGQRR